MIRTRIISASVKFLLSPIYWIYTYFLNREVRKKPLPKHLAVILDGNRRFATEHDFEKASLGHEVGAKKVREFLLWCLDLELKNITLFAFSTENFKRSKEEVYTLMELMERKFYEFAKDKIIHENGIRIRAIGRLDMLPRNVIKAIRTAEEATAVYNNHLLYVAVAYGGRAELIDAIKRIMKKVNSGETNPRNITETLINQHLYTTNMPPIDLIIRTSGERRISNFLLWQSTNSYLCFLDIFWPAIRKIDLLRAIRTYQRRQAYCQRVNLTDSLFPSTIHGDNFRICLSN